MIIQETVPAFPLSVVIPALDEEKGLPATLDSLALQTDPRPFEVVLADGGSSDGTVPLFLERTRSWPDQGRPAVLVRCPRPGRATQVNMGAAAAAGKALLFLHADTCLPPPAIEPVNAALADAAIVGGGFRHSFNESGPLLRFISLWSTARSRLTGIHLGDQGMFVRRSVFEGLGGFPDIPLFEDARLARAL